MKNISVTKSVNVLQDKLTKVRKPVVRPGPAAIVGEKLIMDNLIFLHNARTASLAHSLVHYY